MDPNRNISKGKNRDIKSDQPNSILQNIKSNYFLERIYDNILKKKSLEIVKYNKKMQNRINLSIKAYKEYSEKFTQIEIEVIPAKNKYGKFIEFYEKNRAYYHIYLNDSKEEYNESYFTGENNVKKIIIIIDYQIKSFKFLFRNCECIESINFKKFFRKNIENMSYMFTGCSSLKELNLSNFNTNNVTDMHGMLERCSSLTELNLSNFNTNNVTNMYGMFYECSSLKELNLNNFNINNVTNMNHMSYGCSDDLKGKLNQINA